MSAPLFFSSGYWQDRAKWRRSAINTLWCLLGCSIGDFGTIAFFQFTGIATGVAWATLSILLLAMLNGILTSIGLETLILSRQMPMRLAFRTAVGMSLVSMVAMESAMNLVDVFLTGGAKLTWYALPFMLLAGFLAPLPYNYWRLKSLGKACH